LGVVLDQGQKSLELLLSHRFLGRRILSLMLLVKILLNLDDLLLKLCQFLIFLKGFSLVLVFHCLEILDRFARCFDFSADSFSLLVFSLNLFVQVLDLLTIGRLLLRELLVDNTAFRSQFIS
jgi:hypothetical protein